MCRVLILDDDMRFAELLKPVVDKFDGNETIVEIATTLDTALNFVKEAVLCGLPYTIFIVDQRLGAGKDGIEAMRELKSISPDSSAIMLTGINDHEVGVRAYQAGAYRYLAKPVEEEELIFVLKSLMQSRREEIENKWRKTFSEMMETALHYSKFNDIAKAVVDYSLQLGFTRAHLFWAPKQDESHPRNIFVGIEYAGNNCASHFLDIKFPLSRTKELGKILQKHDISFIGNEVAGKKIRMEMNTVGFPFPSSGLWVLPLWGGTELLGALVLDFWKIPRRLSTHEYSLLNFFARQVSVVLEHAGLYIKEKRTAAETAIISKIGKQVSTRAATQNLPNLLEHIRELVGEQFDVSNFSIFLCDEQTNTLHFELLYENDILQKGVSRPIGLGLEEYMLSEQHEINIPDVKGFIKQRGLKMRGKVPFGWLGVPLQVGEKIIGGVCIKQRNKDKGFSERDMRILRAVADQVAGAVQISKLKKEEDEDREHMQLLHRVNMEMLRIAWRSEHEFWLTVLTIATANFGLGFNRALLFLARDNDEIFYGKAGIGTNEKSEARRHWKRDEKRNYDFETFLRDMDNGSVRLTSFHHKVLGMGIPLYSLGEEVRECLQSGQIVRVKGDTASGQLPDLLTAQFNLSECALLPIVAAKSTLGFVIVDNKHNQASMNEKALNSLQSLLSNAGLVLEILRQHEKSDDLLDANLEILGMASHQSLKSTLDRICKTACLISQADWAIIHPFTTGKQPDQIEVKNVGHYGELRGTSITDLTNNNLRIGGVSKYVLRKGGLIVEDIDRCNPNIGKLQLTGHHFIKAEGVKALIGMAIIDPYSKDALGILYLDYRKPREFSESDIRHARSLVSLAAVAISNAREMEEVKQRRQFKLATEIAEAVGASLNLETTMDAILNKLSGAFRETRLCVLLYDKRLHALNFAPAALKYYKINNPKYARQDTFHLDGGTIACRVAKQALMDRKLTWENVGDVIKDHDYLRLDARVKSEFCISLLSASNELLGILALEKGRINGFGSQDIELIKTVAQHISITIERAQQSEELEYKSTVAAQTSWAANIAHEINNEVGKILNGAYIIQRITGENLEAQEYAKSIEESASKLSVSNPWSNKPAKVVEIDALLRKNLEQSTLSRGINVEFHLGAPETKVKIKTIQFQHVLRQLVNNAARAMKESREKKISVSTQLISNNASVEILFQDFGPGIHKDKHVSAFRRPFTTKDTGGYGLLFIRQMVEDIQGEITLHPYQKGKGAAFSIRIPVADLTAPMQSE